MSKEGYIFLHRKIEEWEWYDDANTFRLFIHCLLEANHTEKQWRGVAIKRGQFITSQPKLANSLKLSVQQIRTALNKLKSTGEITVYTTADYSVITVKNYDDYQQSNSLINSLITDKQQANNSLITTTNNDNNEKNEKNIYLAQEEKKKIDPFYHPAIITYEKLFKEIIGKRCYLDAKHRTKIIELNADIENFEDTIPTVLKRLKFIKFDKIGFVPNSSWLLKEDNYIKVLEGTFGTKEKEEEYIYNAYN